MYRVELKGVYCSPHAFMGKPVPNVPCGVERGKGLYLRNRNLATVPNVPCGVESQKTGLSGLGT